MGIRGHSYLSRWNSGWKIRNIIIYEYNIIYIESTILYIFSRQPWSLWVRAPMIQRCKIPKEIKDFKSWNESSSGVRLQVNWDQLLDFKLYGSKWLCPNISIVIIITIPLIKFYGNYLSIEVWLTSIAKPVFTNL